MFFFLLQSRRAVRSRFARSRRDYLSLRSWRIKGRGEGGKRAETALFPPSLPPLYTPATQARLCRKGLLAVYRKRWPHDNHVISLTGPSRIEPAALSRGSSSLVLEKLLSLDDNTSALQLSTIYVIQFAICEPSWMRNG